MIERTTSDAVTTFRLAHGKASVLDLDLVEAVARAFAEEAKTDSRAVILTGTGSIFSAGVDLFRLLEEGSAYAQRFVPALARMYLDLFAFPKPLIVSVNGHAIAGGCIFTLCGDYRLMAPGNGRIGIPELLVGVPFPGAVLEIVRFALPPQHLQMLAYTGRTVLPDEALRLGIVDEVADHARAEEVARQFAALPVKAFAMAKRQLRDKSISRAKHYTHEFDRDAVDLWSDPETYARVRDHLGRNIHK